MSNDSVVRRSKDHRHRKNPGSREHFRQLSHDANAARPPQRFLGIDPKTGKGLGWVRDWTLGWEERP